MTEPIPYKSLSSEEQHLVDAAWEVCKNAYCPYSNFPVGSALSTEDGKIFTGCNIENASWSPSVCSERVAMGAAISAGYRKFKAIAIVCGSRQGGWSCGVCRQFMSEFGLDLIVISVVDKDKSVLKKPLSELLPDSFGPQSL